MGTKTPNFATLPEMIFDVASGNDIRFNALDAFSDWKHEGLPPVEVPSAAQWKFRRTSRAGLTSEDAEVRVHIFGQNKLEEKPENKFLKFLSFMWNPLSWVKWKLSSDGHCPCQWLEVRVPDWQDFCKEILYALSDISIQQSVSIEENQCWKMLAAALMARLAPIKNKSLQTLFKSPEMVSGQETDACYI
ncbi:hypothetical protein GOBAR_DD10499 [Gossypium barbadense]|nr:hypothetical protein GOBAR_DD10499 [Gossypium barbadense]